MASTSWHGPRRTVWFLIGAATATWWMHHKDAHRQTHERYFGHCFRPPVHPIQPRLPDSPPPQPVNTEPPRWRPQDVPNTINNMPPAPLPWGYPESHRDRQWEEEKLKLQAIGRQAEEVMTKISEATLDSVMTTMEALKLKLAEHRAQREEAQRQLEEQLEEQKKNPHRFV
ncbi:hypothetical protein B0H16DRAFT_1719947 [Mycena metata]|uniref:Uncharacterized protein n=1 Tax=Mycena metata TaxID=1033252 RepID=A0AAD7JA01_9AGAR|nr:hypothetical protein B0H16DRAFT_1719947 [Mycena metata]